MTNERCGTCRFYNRTHETRHDQLSDIPLHEEDYEAECRRFPPVRGDADYFGELGNMGVLRDAYSGPTVNTAAWCGEWRSVDLPPSRR